MYVSSSHQAEPVHMSVTGYTGLDPKEDMRFSMRLDRTTVYLSQDEAMWLSAALSQLLADTEKHYLHPGGYYYSDYQKAGVLSA